MSQNLIKLAIVLLVATGLASLALFDNGRVSMVWQGWVIETSMTFAIVIALLFFGAVYLIVRLILNTLHLPETLRRRKMLKQYGRSETQLSKGMLALEVGDWKTAEKQLIKTAQKTEGGLVHYLNAAKMAHQQGAWARRDQYLQEARKRFPEDYVIIGLVESRLLKLSKPDVAETILGELYAQNPKHKVVLEEYAALLRQQKNWPVLESILPALRRYKVLEKADLLQLSEALWMGKMQLISDFEALETFWDQVPNEMKVRSSILAEYVKKRLDWGQEVGLAKQLEKAINKQFDEQLVYLYGRLQFGPAFERLKVAEKWHKKYPETPVLLLTMGRLACQSQLWGQGQFFLKQSLKLQPELETFHALAKCYESEGESEQAALVYKEAILQLEDKTAKLS